MAPIKDKANVTTQRPDLSNALPHERPWLEDNTRCPPSKFMELQMKRLQLAEAKKQFREASDKLVWIGKEYGVQSPEYKTQQQVTKLHYDRMVALQRDVDALEWDAPNPRPYPNDLFDNLPRNALAAKEPQGVMRPPEPQWADLTESFSANDPIGLATTKVSPSLIDPSFVPDPDLASHVRELKDLPRVTKSPWPDVQFAT